MHNNANLFESLFYGNSSVMLLIDSATGEIKDANNSACTYYGWSHSEMCGKNISEINILSREFINAELENAAQEIKNHFYFKHRLASGEVRDVEVFSSVNRSDSSKLLLAIIHDITAQKQAEELLKNNEEKFRCIVESSPIAKYFYRLENDDRLILVGANPAADRIVGINHQTLIGKTIEEAFPQLAETEIPAMYRQIAAGILGAQSLEVPYKDDRFSGFYKVTVFQAGANQIVVDFVDVSEQKHAAQALRESEEKYRLLHENSGIGIGYYTPDGTVLSYNRLAASYTNKTPEDFIGKSIYELFPKQKAEFYHTRITAACLAEKPMVYEEIVPLPSGTRFFLSTFTKITNTENNILGIQIISQDITELKQAAFNLSESESRFRSVFEQSPVGSVFVGLDKKFVRCNPAFCAFLGYEEGELVGKTIEETTYPPDLEIGIKELRLIAEGKVASFTAQKRYVRKDGALVWGEISISLVRDATGKPLYFLPIIKDITERKKAEDALQETLQQLAKAQEIAHLGSWELDSSKGHLIWSDETYRIFGLEPQEYEATYDAFLNAVHPDDRARVDVAFRASLKDRLENYQIEHKIIRQRSGEVRFVQEKCEHVRDASGKILRSLGMIQDITERKKAEEEHLKYEQQLQQTQKLESLGLLAGGIAHDFNNLLGGIYGYIDLAGEGAKDDKISRYLSKAMNTIERARGLTLQLLTFAKGGAPIKKIGNLFPFVQETAQFALSGSNVLCTFNVEPDLCACDFDKNQIGQVIDNIVINAKQAMPDGGTIEVLARNRSVAENEHPPLVPGQYVVIAIKDCGIGIPKKILPKIFDPFYTTKATGHGLGLATCFSIVNRHGGAIEVESEPGEGSTFHIFLPALQNNNSSSTDRVAVTHKGNGVFLVMDDQEVMRDTIGEMLTSFGYTVVGKENGSDAIDFVHSEMSEGRKIAGMILDITIPGGMGGREAIGEIRKMDKETPVFVFSGYAEDPIMATPREYGFTASICKPFRKSELSEMLNNYVKQGA